MSRSIRWLVAGITALGLLTACGADGNATAEADGPVVLAATSLQESLTEIAEAFAAAGNRRPALSFAATSAVARQVENGAPADLVVAADEAWMTHLEQGGRLAQRSRADIALNRLVVVAPKGWAGAGSDPFEGNGKIAIADPAGVPAGRYARAALAGTGRLDQLAPRLVPAESVRAALALVEREQVDRGIVYATDALASNKVEVVYRFPKESHPPIVYPAALIAGSDHPDARAFLDFLQSLESRTILRKHGFNIPGDRDIY